MATSLCFFGSKPSWAHTDQKSGVIPAGGSIDLVVSELATENGDYSAVVKIKPAVFMPQNTEINLSMSVSSPTCSPAVNLIAETDTFHVVNLSWDEVVAGENESVSYLVYDGSSAMPIDTAQTNSYTVSDPEPGQLMRVRAQRGENAADIGALQGIGDLHAEKAEAQVHQLAES